MIIFAHVQWNYEAVLSAEVLHHAMLMISCYHVDTKVTVFIWSICMLTVSNKHKNMYLVFSQKPKTNETWWLACFTGKLNTNV